MNSPEHVYDHPDGVGFELQERNPAYCTIIKSGIVSQISTSKSGEITKSKPIPEGKTQNNYKVTAAVIVVTCVNILLALCGLVAAVLATVNLVELQVNVLENAEVAGAGDGTSGAAVQMLSADVNVTQYQLGILEEDVARLVAVHNTSICLVPGE